MQLRRRRHSSFVSLDSHIGEEQQGSLSEILVDDRPDPEVECHNSMLHRRLMKSAATLSPVLRKTFQLRFEHHLSIEETARRLGVPRGTVKARTARARTELRKSVTRKSSE
jgi:RNA polymerase sigma factor (sigma-70 family)